MKQMHLFIMDPLPKLNLQLDSSLRMACELSKLGHSVYMVESSELAWYSPSRSCQANCRQLLFPGGSVGKVTTSEPKRAYLADFQGLHMRKEPPFNGDYITTTWLLDSVVGRCHIFNQPEALRSLNEKLSILLFPDCAKSALVSCEPGEIVAFIREHCAGDGIIKPLDLFGGKGIVRLNLGELGGEAALAQVGELTAGGKDWRLVQAFNPAIYEGEVRVFAVGGEPLAWCLKKPKAGDFFANTSAGASLLPYTPSPDLQATITTVARKLYNLGVSLVGFDVIGGALSEINITSPRLLQAPGDSNNYYEKIATWLAHKCREKPDS